MRSTNSIYKYRIKEFMQRMTYEQHRQALEELPQLLSISKSTFDRWTYLSMDNHFDIPFCQILLLANYFGCRETDLYTKNDMTHED